MRVENPGDTPAAGNLFQPCVIATENSGSVDSEQLKRMTGVIVRCGVAGCEVVLVEAAGISIRTGVYAVAPAILGINHEGIRKVVLQFEQ